MYHLSCPAVIERFIPVFFRAIGRSFIRWFMHLHHTVVSVSMACRTCENRTVAISSHVVCIPVWFCSVMQTIWNQFIGWLPIQCWLYGLLIIIHVKKTIIVWAKTVFINRSIEVITSVP